MVQPIKDSFGISDFQVGLLQGVAFGTFYAIFGLPMGWLVDRYPRRLIIYIGTACWSIATATCGLTATYWQLFIARFSVGIGEATLSPAAASMIADLFPASRLALAIGVFATGTAIGSAIALIGGGELIGELQKIGQITLPILGVMKPWQIVFVVSGLPGVLIALLMFTIPEPIRKDNYAGLEIAQNFGKFVSAHSRYFICHFTGFGLIAVLAYGAGAWMPTMLMRTYGMSVAHAGLTMGLFNICLTIPGFIIGGWLVDSWYAKGCTDAHLRYFMIACLIAAGFAFVSFYLATTLWGTLAAYVVVHFLQPFTGPSFAHLQLVTPMYYRGRISAMFALVFNLMGMCIGPPSVALLTDQFFGDPLQIKSSLAIMYVGVALAAALMFALGLAPARRMVQIKKAAEIPEYNGRLKYSQAESPTEKA